MLRLCIKNLVPGKRMGRSGGAQRELITPALKSAKERRGQWDGVRAALSDAT